MTPSPFRKFYENSSVLVGWPIPNYKNTKKLPVVFVSSSILFLIAFWDSFSFSNSSLRSAVKNRMRKIVSNDSWKHKYNVCICDTEIRKAYLQGWVWECQHDIQFYFLLTAEEEIEKGWNGWNIGREISAFISTRNCKAAASQLWSRQTVGSHSANCILQYCK